MSKIDLQVVTEVDLKAKIGQLRAVPVNIAGTRCVLAIWGADFDVDPYTEMFYFPTDTLKMTLFEVDGGKVLWQRDLGPGVVPGMWFCPVLAVDLDGDGVEEIWFVNNADPQHPLRTSKYVLERVDPRTGEATGQWPWLNKIRRESLSHIFRNFLMAGQVQGKPVLVLAQGTYQAMHLEGRGLDENGELARLWTHDIRDEDPGARGSHRCPVVDIDGDGNDELMWGERCIRLDDGSEMFCCDRESYRGHSDVIQPTWMADEQRWLLYTCREGDPKASPRVATYDQEGRRLWGDLDAGHIDMGCVFRFPPDGRAVAVAIRIGHKTCGPDGRVHVGMNEFAYDMATGEKLELGYSIYQANPVDIDGDGFHEIYRTTAGIGDNGEILDAAGNTLASVPGQASMACKFADLPGEQLLTWTPEGRLRVLSDRNAVDSERALWRYAHPFYQANRRLTSSGYNFPGLGGL